MESSKLKSKLLLLFLSSVTALTFIDLELLTHKIPLPPIILNSNIGPFPGTSISFNAVGFISPFAISLLSLYYLVKRNKRKVYSRGVVLFSTFYLVIVIISFIVSFFVHPFEILRLEAEKIFCFSLQHFCSSS